MAGLISLFRVLLGPKPSGKEGILMGQERKHITEERKAYVGAHREIMMTVPVRGGSNGPYRIHIEKEPNQHVMLVGHTGSGKSTAMQAFLVRAFLDYGIPFLIIDWSGSYRKMSDAVNVWRVPDELRINPFALRGMKPERRAGIASETLMHALELTPLQTQKVRETLIELYRENSSPELNHVYDALQAHTASKELMKMQFTHIANRLGQAGTVFGYETADFWGNYAKTCNVVELEGLTDAEKKLVTYSLMQRITEQFTSENSTKLYIALDDAYQALKSTYNNESPISKIVREGRKYGFGMTIATQLLSDLPQAVIANTAVKMIFSYQEQLGSRDITALMRLKWKEQELLQKMPPGSCLLFDQQRANEGRYVPAYVQVSGLTEKETELLGQTANRIDIKVIAETPSFANKNAARNELFKGIEIPSVSVYRFVIALQIIGSVKAANKMLRKRGWLTSLTSIYGTKSKPSILSRAKACGYVDEEGKLTEKAHNLIDPGRMIARQGIRAGSEEHKLIMEDVIKAVQQRGNFAFVSSEKDSPDVMELPVHGETKAVWDFDLLKGYEVQMNAIKEEIDKCIERSKRFDTWLVFVTSTDQLAMAIKEAVGKEAPCENVNTMLQTAGQWF